MTWLERTPLAVVSAHLEMLPKLEAEGCVQSVDVAAIAKYMQHGSWMSKTFKEWKSTATSGTPALKPRPGDLEAMGIAVKGLPNG